MDEQQAGQAAGDATGEVAASVAASVAVHAARLYRLIPARPAETLGRTGDNGPARRQAPPAPPAPVALPVALPGPDRSPTAVLPATLGVRVESSPGAGLLPPPPAAGSISGQPPAPAPVAVPAEVQVPVSAGPAPVAPGVPSAMGERLLGALELTLVDFDPPVPSRAAAALGAAATVTGPAHGLAVGVVAGGGGDSFSEPMQLLDQLLPGATDTTITLVRDLWEMPVVARLVRVEPGPAPHMAAEHGRAVLAVCAAAAAVVIRAGDPAHGDAVFDQYRPETVVGVALRAATRLITELDMPTGWDEARQAERRASYLLPRTSAVQLVAEQGRFALIEGGAADHDDAVPPSGLEADLGEDLVRAVPGGLVIATGRPDAAVTLTLHLDHTAPTTTGESGAIAEEWEDVVELSYTAVAGAASPTGAPFTVWPRTSELVTFPWPGPVRARVLASSRGAGGRERFELHLWPAPVAPPLVLRRRRTPAAPTLPWTAGTPLIRTDFTHPDTWPAIARAATSPDRDGFTGDIEPVEDPAYGQATVEDLLALATSAWRREHHLLLIADHTTHTDPEFPLLAVDIGREPGRRFRVTPAAAQLVEVNLAVVNLDFADYARSVGPDGVHRGW